MSSGSRVNMGLAAVLVILVTVCSYSLLSIDKLVDTQSDVAQTQEARSLVRATQVILADAEAGERAYLLTGDTAYLEPVRQARHSMTMQLENLERLTAVNNPRQANRLHQLAPVVRQRFASMEAVIAARRARGMAAAMPMFASERRLADSLRIALNAIAGEELLQLAPRRRQAENQAHVASGLVFAGAAVAVFVVIGLVVLLRRDLEARLAGEALYHSVVDALADGVFVRDASGKIVECNPSALRILGLTREQVIGLPEGAMQCYAEDGTPMAVAARPGVEARKSGQGAANTVMGVRRPDGEMRWLLVNASPMYVNGSNRLAGVTTSFTDITRRKRAEAAVRDNRERLQDFLDNAGDLILISNADGRILYANRAWRAAMGFTDEADVVGRPVTGFIEAGAQRERYAEAFTALLRGESILDQETVFVGRDGQKVVATGKSSCRFEHGIPVAVRSIFRDMTEINVAQEQLLLAIEQASAANRSKSEFLANMSHELRTPLNSVIGFASVLLRNRGGNLTPQDCQYLGRIHDNGRHLLALINNVLDLSKVEAGRMDLDLTTVDLGELVRDTLAQLEPQVQGRPVVLRAVVPAQLAPFTADAGKLRQVLINLVANALKFTEKGSVTVKIAADARTQQPVALDVCDTGIGIPLDRQGAVFEAFRQADNSTARRFGGTGLGLTISRSLCQLMGYGISLTSEPGVGTTFTVALADEALARSATGTHAVADGGETPRVLIIDDDPDARILLSQYALDAGCKPTVTGTGEQGLRLAAELKPQLIVLDVVMPQMNGLEVMERLKADPAIAGIPVVIVSIVATEQRHRAVGAAALVDKPVARAEFEAVLRRHLAEPRLAEPGVLKDLIRRALAVPVLS